MHIKKGFSLFSSLMLVIALVLGVFSTASLAAQPAHAASPQKGWRWVLIKSAVPRIPPNTDKRFELSTSLAIDLGRTNGIAMLNCTAEYVYEWQ